VRVILLDTRSGRSDYPLSFIGSVGVGTWLGKLSPLIAASTRTFCALTGLSRRFAELGWWNDQMLDKVQWKWLEQQLEDSPASVNILVSSVQVLTRTPSVEAWGHFPLERRRLLHLLKKTKPKGLLIVSGDIHIAIASALDDSPESAFLEATSSGLTHTCTAGGIPHFICALVWNVFESPKRKATMILSRNFGSLEIDWDARSFGVAFNSLTEDHNRTVSFNRSMASLEDFDVDAVPDLIPEHSDLILLGSFAILFAILGAILLRCRRSR
jgi:alkaline phosphatase D